MPCFSHPWRTSKNFSQKVLLVTNRTRRPPNPPKDTLNPITLTEDEVQDALEAYIATQFNLISNQEVTVEVTTDGTALVNIRSIKQGAQAAKASQLAYREEKPKAKRGRPRKSETRQDAVEKEEAQAEQSEEQSQSSNVDSAIDTSIETAIANGSLTAETTSDDSNQDEEADQPGLEVESEPADEVPAEKPEPAKAGSIFGSPPSKEDPEPEAESQEAEKPAQSSEPKAPPRSSIFSKVS